MITNSDITIYNKKFNKITRLNEWNLTQIQAVNWYNDIGVSAQGNLLQNADTFKIRIPKDAIVEKQYVESSAYSAMTDISGHWTIGKDDIVAKGLLTESINGLADLTKLGILSFTVRSYSDNRRGTLEHWRIGGM